MALNKLLSTEGLLPVKLNLEPLLESLTKSDEFMSKMLSFLYNLILIMIQRSVLNKQLPT